MELAVKEIHRILTDTNELHGWTIPKYIVDYESRVLAQRIAQPHWQPEPSYAERFLQLRSAEAALELANTCWFTRSVFPELGSRRGITADYYVQMGLACYDWAQRNSPSPTLQVMRDHFEFLAECAYTAIRHYGDFRSMWD